MAMRWMWVAAAGRGLGAWCCVGCSSLAVELQGFGGSCAAWARSRKKGAVCADVWGSLKAFCFKPPQKQPPAAIFLWVPARWLAGAAQAWHA